MTGLSREETERYSRQLVLPEVGRHGQEKLKNASVVVVGAGGLGLPAAMYIVAAGVGRVRVIDGDEVERSNLHRQTLYSEADIGSKKAEVAAERLHLVNPHVKVDPRAEKLDSSNALDLLGGHDVVLDCTDNLPARYLINDACVMLHRPDVYASVLRSDGQATVFDADRGPCYRCLYPTPPPPDAVQDCATAGVLGVLPGILGSIQATQALRLILGNGTPLVGRLLVVDGNDMTFSELKVKKDPSCHSCGIGGRIGRLVDYEEFCGTRREPARTGEVTPAALRKEIDSGRAVVLVDVREPSEYEVCRLEDSMLIPLGELPRRLGELDPTAETVVYCHTGNRSARAASFLSSKGFRKVRNLTGGIEAWAEEVDPSIPRY